MLGGVRIARIRGIDIRVHASLLIVFVLIAASVGAALLPHWHPEWSPALRWGVAVIAAVLFFATIAVHELAHALVGRSRGTPIDGITLFVLGGVTRMRGEPPSAGAELLMAIVGPLTSLVIGLVATVVGVWLVTVEAPPGVGVGEALAAAGPVATLLIWLGPLNLALAVFNMVPGFPLDGGRVLRAALWWATGDLARATRWSAAVGQGFGWLLMTLGLLMALDVPVPLLGSGFLSGLWLVLIGWFLENAARASYMQVVVRAALDHVPVRAVMRSRPDTVEPTMTLEELVTDRIMNSDQRAFPVLRDGELIGQVGIGDVRAVPRGRWPAVRVADVMTPASRLEVVDVDETALEALDHLGAGQVDELPVTHDHALFGVVRHDDIVKWVSMRSGLELR